MTRSVVVFPAPLTPSSPKISAGRTSKLIPFRIGLPPSSSFRSVSLTTGAAALRAVAWDPSSAAKSALTYPAMFVSPRLRHRSSSDGTRSLHHGRVDDIKKSQGVTDRTAPSPSVWRLARSVTERAAWAPWLHLANRQSHVSRHQ